MKSHWTSLIVLFVTAAIYCGMVQHFYPLLPDRIASHFNGAGIADSWMPKRDFVITFGVLIVGLWAVMSGVNAALPRLPENQLNLPNKSYWLAPERAAETWTYIMGYMNFTVAATLALLTAVVYFVFQANLTPAPRMAQPITYLAAAFVIGMALSTIVLVRRFSRMPA